LELITLLEIAAVVLGITVGSGGILATLWAVGKVRGVETSIDLLSSANEALRSANEDLRVELSLSERDCGERIARLEGQNAALLDGLGDKLAHAIAGRLESILSELSWNIVERIQQHRPPESRTRSTDDAGNITRRGDVGARDSRP
jgi:hypothetical protein